MPASSRSELEEELERLRRTTERDKELMQTLQSQLFKGRLEYLDMEEKWDKERRVRMKMEQVLLDAGYEVNIVDEAEVDEENEDIESVHSSGQIHGRTLSQSTSTTSLRYITPPAEIFDRQRSPSTPMTDPEVEEMSPPKVKELIPSQKQRKTPSTPISAPIFLPRLISSSPAEASSSKTTLKRKRSFTKPQPTPILPSKSSYNSRLTSRSQLTTSTTPISPPPLPVSISRRALSKCFGSPIHSLRWHSKDHSHRFLFSKFKSHPHAPSSPGKSGVILDLGVDGYRGGPWCVFYECGDEKKGVWGYAGEYLASGGGEVNETDWQILADATKKAYATRILKSRDPGTALDIRTRISFRRANGRRTPSSKELKQYIATLLANGFDDSLMLEDIDDAFAMGEEHLRIIHLNFTSYDYDRARELIQAQEDFFTPRDPTEDVLIKTEQTEPKVPKKKSATPKTKKQALSSSSTGGKPPKVFVEIRTPRERTKVDRVSA